MANITNPRNYDVGVVVGRFQVPHLHEGHKELLSTVHERHQKMIVVLGVSVTANTISNPLDFEARRKMINDFLPDISVANVGDVGDDGLWSKRLDQTISGYLTPNQTCVLYGGRDSFISAYNGKFDTFEMMQRGYQSGTEIRNNVKNTVMGSEDFRRGVIWASANRYPTVFPCVDVALFTEDRKNMWLGQKNADGGMWRLIGGFADPKSESYEMDAYREVYEETHMGIDGLLQYVGSFKVDDWRYRNEPDCIRTSLFVGFTSDQGQADDDLDNLKVFAVDYVREHPEMIVPEHRGMVQSALVHLTKDQL